MKKFLKILFVIVACVVVALTINNVKSDSNDTSTRAPINFEQEFGWKSMYYYNQLDEDSKTAYLEMYSSVKNFEDQCTLYIDKPELAEVFKAVLYDNPEIFWIKTDYKYFDYGSKIVFKPNYSYSQEDAVVYTNELNAKINEILSQANFAVTDYDKELFFHDYICENVMYDMSTYGTVGASAHNALINGKAVCEGYARSMQILLDKSGIYNYLVVGDATSDGTTEPHMWNVIKINNMNYHLDVTWDDLDDSNEPSYLYFNVTDDLISLDHSNFSPADNNCYDVYYNYSMKNRTYAYSFYGFSQFVDATSSILRTGRNCVEIRFQNQSDYIRAEKAIDDNAKFFEYIGSSVKKSGRKLKTDTIDCYCDDELQYIRIIFKEG